jgi:hypothetical protein
MMKRWWSCTPVIELDWAFYRPRMGKISLRRSSWMSSTEELANLVTAACSGGQPAVWHEGKSSGRCGTRQW